MPIRISAAAAFRISRRSAFLRLKGYCYGWHFYQAADADMIISSEDALFGHASFRYVGWAAAHVAMGARRWACANFMEMVFTGPPVHRQGNVRLQFRQQRRAARQARGRNQKYALACARNRPTDTVVMQKTLFEAFKQQQGEYMGSMLTGWLESMLPAIMEDDDEMGVDSALFEKGLNNAVKNNDRRFPADWRLSYGGRKR